MKKIFITLGVIFMVGISTAQEGMVSVNLYGGYNFKETVPFDLAAFVVSDGMKYGVGLEYFLSRSTSLKLKYNRMETDFSTSFLDRNDGVRKSGSSNGSLSYVLFGANGYFIQMEDSKVIPFVGASLGIGIVDSENS